MHISKFDYKLPNSLIAQKPIEPRHNSKLLSCVNENLQDLKFINLPNILDPGDIIIVNDTKVIKAKVLGRINEKKINFTLHIKISKNKWFAFSKPAKKCKINDHVIFSENLSAKIVEKKFNGEVLLAFNLYGKELMKEISRCGQLQLPPYIKDNSNNDDNSYQSYFAKNEGAIAAPTASLHFTSDIIKKLKSKKIDIVTITLHVGAGTFLPVKVDDINKHEMYFEEFKISKKTVRAIKKAKNNGNKIIAVGTTVMRALETVAIKFDELKSYEGKTDLYIKPGFKFQIVDFLITNFHLPKSTLLILISAFSGYKNVRKIYEYAIKKSYRFYTYGDCCLLKRK